MNRRGFLGMLAGLAGTAAVDPEQLLWTPGAKTIFVPSIAPVEFIDFDDIPKNHSLAVSQITREALKILRIFDDAPSSLPFSISVRSGTTVSNSVRMMGR